MEEINIVYPSLKYFARFYQTLSKVASERIYIEFVEAPLLEKLIAFQTAITSINGPVYYAVENDRVVGWCDVFPEDNPGLSHRGTLGRGLLPEFRGKGIGSRLLEAVLNHAKKFGLEKVELNVYTTKRPWFLSVVGLSNHGLCYVEADLIATFVVVAYLADSFQ